MSIAKHELDSATPFAKWLMTNLNLTDTTRTKLADELHMTRKTILKHCKGYCPKFTDIVAYCWCFSKVSGYYHDPEPIWQIVVREFNITDI